MWSGILAASIVLSLAVFSPSLNGPLVFDDYHLPFADPNAGLMGPGFWIGGVRPVLMLTYWANYLASGVAPFSYHLGSIGLHALAAFLFFRVLHRLLTLSGERDNSGAVALFGAGVFLLHPLQTESVDYIAGRSEIVCALFLFAGWLIFLYRFTERISPLTGFLILLCGGLAILAKESGICMFALLVATDVYFSDRTRTDWKKDRVWLYGPIAVGFFVAVAFILRGLARSATAGFSTAASPFEYALTECRAILIYLRLFVVPVGQNVDWQLPFFRSFSDGGAWIFALGITALIAAAIALWRRAHLVSLGIVIFLAALAPTSSIVPISDALAERRMYVPIAGLVIALIGAVQKVRVDRKLQVAAATAVLLTLGTLSYARSELWGSDVSLWQDALKRNPRNNRALSGLGGAYMLRHECASAVKEYRLVIDIEGMNQLSGSNLASAYDCDNQKDKALETYRALVAVHPTSEAYNRIGFLEALREQADAALAAFDDALRLDPNNATAYSYRGTARMALKRTDEARADFQRALNLDPGNAVASKGMAAIGQNR